MAQGKFTKQEADETIKALNEMFDAIPKTRRMNYIGHLNDISLFIGAAKRAAPDEAEVKK
jgi:hypothetical protein